MNDFSRYNDGSQNAPRLRTAHALWSLIGLPMNAETEWTLDEKFERVKAAGFEAVECWLNDENEAETKAALDRHGLRLVMGHRPFDLEEVITSVARAKRLGADFLFAQISGAFSPLSEAAKIATEGRKIANDAGLCFFVETHRNNFTETIPQTLQLIEAVPDIRINADLSHLVLVSEFYGWDGEGAAERMMPILERVSQIHGRISNGEAIQVDVGEGDTDPAKFFLKLWTIAMRHWLMGARPGDIFHFASELGPPRYAITLPDGREFSDRWTQSLVMKKLAEQAWQDAHNAI